LEPVGVADIGRGKGGRPRNCGHTFGTGTWAPR
jgi:hypothetical protein